MPAKLDCPIGVSFNRWTALGDAGVIGGRTQWRVRCGRTGIWQVPVGQVRIGAPASGRPILRFPFRPNHPPERSFAAADRRLDLEQDPDAALARSNNLS